MTNNRGPIYLVRDYGFIRRLDLPGWSDREDEDRAYRVTRNIREATGFDTPEEADSFAKKYFPKQRWSLLSPRVEWDGYSNRSLIEQVAYADSTHCTAGVFDLIHPTSVMECVKNPFLPSKVYHDYRPGDELVKALGGNGRVTFRGRLPKTKYILVKSKNNRTFKSLEHISGVKPEVFADGQQSCQYLAEHRQDTQRWIEQTPMHSIVTLGTNRARFYVTMERPVPLRSVDFGTITPLAPTDARMVFYAERDLIAACEDGSLKLEVFTDWPSVP